MQPHLDNTWWKRLFSIVECTVGVIIFFAPAFKDKGPPNFLKSAFVAGIAVLFIHGVRVGVCYMVEGTDKPSPGPPKAKPSFLTNSREVPRVDNTWWKRLFTVIKWIIGGLIGLAIILAANDKMNEARFFELVGLMLWGGLAIFIVHGIRVFVVYIVEGTIEKGSAKKTPEANSPQNPRSKLP